ncbi:hypothetical protein [Limosilactobacillus viscerum]|uniref:hypothetical protein n=1 Tax=Limosilactobacillus viscerum TaxID=2993450 RepID=UPI0024B932EF|nr:hypothetical protein [Limosilactobacillus viscerum]
MIKEQYETLVKKRDELNKTINYLAYKLDHFESHVIPFLEEDEYYQLRKKKMLKQDN